MFNEFPDLPGWMLIAVPALLLALILILHQSRRDARRAAAGLLSESRSARKRDYMAAKRDLRKFKNEIRKKCRNDAVVIDLICDLGDQWEDRDAPRYISYEQAIQAQQQIQPLSSVKNRHKLPTLIVVLHTLGGYSQSAQLIANAVHSYPGPTVAYVPYIAMSGGTKIALAAEQIVMGPTACLGPVDTQYSGVSNGALQTLRSDAKIKEIPAGVLLTMYEAAKYDEFAVEHVKNIVHKNHINTKKLRLLDPDGKHENVASFLASGEWAHGRSIFAQIASDVLGLNVSTKCPRRVVGYVDARIRMIDTQIEQEEKLRLANTKSTEDEPPEPSAIARLKVLA